MNLCNTLILISTIICFLNVLTINAQRTSLDTKLIKFYRSLRGIFSNVLGDTSRHFDSLSRAGKTQLPVPKDFKFCDAKNGPGRRSDVPPTSVHRLRPGDIDIIGAIGDSLTAGNGIYAEQFFEIPIENRGSVWSIGGDANWRKILTLPNILKEFNPNLYGFSVGTGLATDYSSRFNVAELGAMSRDVPYEAQILLKRLKSDTRVNMTHHWKLLTIFIGNNDFCTNMCDYNPKVFLKHHENDMVKTLRYLRDNVPRLFVNVVPAPNLNLLTEMIGRPAICEKTLTFECPCLFGKPRRLLDFYGKIMQEWAVLDSKIVRRSEFNTETFTVVFQPFTQFIHLPLTPMGATDFRYLSADCFHISQRSHAMCANSVWNNMLEPEGSKTTTWYPAFETFKCPSPEQPFLRTRNNSIATSL